ncbi:branched-chain amino acid ABC transporter permease [Leuconostoc kimchii]|uniref:Branched-chain amino acid ABC transporter permease n=1 Tax=Leuconostoc kimchii TaxID=136609 RepID=A0ABX5SIW2_9LACO|nr:branched-chain amino acid ABC transporter permease [Leuconostoc kimchii]QBR47289.1 branched-chain amino acid ABC transporter permease [Leuconostoc kimchii]
MDKAHIKYTLSWATLALMIVILIVVMTMFDIIGPYGLTTIVLIGINLIAAIGLNLIIGMSGQFSLGHAGFMAIGAYATALIVTSVPTIFGFIISLLVGAMLSGIVALIVGIPTLRLRGDYLAIATLGVSEIIRILIMNFKFTRGPAGIFAIPSFVTWPLVFGLAVLTIIIVVNLVRSPIGRAIISVRDNEIAAESLGINTTKYKVIAFVLGAVLAALAGGLRASFIQSVSPQDFTFMQSITILIIVVLGGIGSISGTVVTAVALGILDVILQNFGSLRMVVYAVVLIVVMLFRPQGLFGRSEFSLKKMLFDSGGDHDKDHSKSA